LQTFHDWELILLDDASLDNSLEIINSFADDRIHIIAGETNVGLPATLNKGIALAQGKYLARMDQDDIAFPERLAKQVEFLTSNEDIDLLGTAALVFTSDGQISGQFPLHIDHDEICAKPFSGFYLPHPTWMGKTEWFRRYKYNVNAVRTEDQDLLLRSYRDSKFACLPEILLGYRQDSVSFKNIFYGRRSYIKSLFRELSGHEQKVKLILGMLKHIVKLFIDWIAINFGMTKLFHNHRALPTINNDDQKRWRICWNNCHKKLKY
jgi:glycosyltransferase involved in cell wall biosynthesis